MGRAARSSYGRVVRPPGRPAIHGLPPVQQIERVEWALARLSGAYRRAALHPDDAALKMAVTARREEYEHEKHLLARLTPAPKPKRRKK